MEPTRAEERTEGWDCGQLSKKTLLEEEESFVRESWKQQTCVGFEALTAVTIKNSVLWDVAPCGFVLNPHSTSSQKAATNKNKQTA
jgi:hypothetical protein